MRYYIFGVTTDCTVIEKSAKTQLATEKIINTYDWSELNVIHGTKLEIHTTRTLYWPVKSESERK